jgi:hypothetical protein
MRHKKILYVILFTIVFLVGVLIYNTRNLSEEFTNIRKPEDHEHEYILPVLRLLYSDEIKFIDSSETADLIIAQKSLPTSKKPYILMNGEPRLRNDRNYETAIKDPYCVAAIVTSLDFDDNNKTIYLPMILDRGHVSFTKSPFIRKYTNSERPNLAAYIAKHSPPHRSDFFKALRKLDSTVDGLGEANRTKEVNLPSRDKWWELTDVYKNYKFGFAMENTMENGYLTEKIMNVYLGGAVPLYWGSPIVKDIFNPKSFIYINDYPDFDSCAKDVVAIGNDPVRLREMQKAPIFLNNSKFQHYYDVPAPKWLVEIADRIKQNMGKIKTIKS